MAHRCLVDTDQSNPTSWRDPHGHQAAQYHNLCLFSRALHYQHVRGCMPGSLPSTRHCHKKTGYITRGGARDGDESDRARTDCYSTWRKLSVSTPKRTSTVSWQFVLQIIRQRIAVYMEASHCILVTSLEGRPWSLVGVKNTVQTILPLTRRQWTRDETLTKLPSLHKSQDLCLARNKEQSSNDVHYNRPHALFVCPLFKYPHNPWPSYSLLLFLVHNLHPPAANFKHIAGVHRLSEGRDWTKLRHQKSTHA